MGKDWFEKAGHGKLVLILIVLAYFMLMFGNNIVSLTHPDEVFYAQTAKEMVARNSWLTPMIFDAVQFEKPILFYFLSAVLIKIFGISPFIARFWPAFFGIVGVGVVYWISWMLFRNKRQSFLSGLILSTCFIYVALSRAVLTDMTFSILIAISLGFFCLAYLYPDCRSKGLIGWMGFAGLAVLTKGLLGLSFTLTPVILFLIYKKDFSVLKHPSRWIAFFIFALIAVPWHVLMYQQQGQWFIDEYWHNVHVRRIFESEHPRIDTWYFYFEVMLGGTMPWSFFLFPAIKTIFKNIKEKAAGYDKVWFLIFWIITVYLYTQVAHCKLASYIFPMFPAIAMILGYYIENVLQQSERQEDPKGLKICGYIMLVFMIVVIMGGYIAAQKYSHIVINMVPIYVTMAIAFLTGLLIFIFNQKKKYFHMVISYTGVTIGLFTMLFLARPYIEPWVSCKGISEVFKKIDTSDTTVLASKFYVRGVRFYTDRKMAVIDINGKGFWSPHKIPFLNSDQKVLDFLDSQPFTFAVVKEGNVEDLERIAKGRYRIEEFDGIGGKYILRLEKQ